ncbi:class IV adenylate cyclase [bacterium]|nr:class IV adenylate cyclase [bacterium]|tara:strand:+ start:2354 stop:2968 length:615 start_codon:yes stop_codon:yes gene_type:complete
MEIEIKAKVKSLAQLRKKILALGAKKITNKHQLDVYLSPPHKSFFRTKYYLRVRHDFLNKDKHSFDYHIFHKGVGACSLSDEQEAGIQDGAVLLKILKQLDFGEICRINKQREVFKYKNFEIVLDKVKKLGNFIEVELDGQLKDEKKYTKRITNFLNKLGVKKSQFCTDQGYVELMTNTSARDWNELKEIERIKKPGISLENQK